MPKAKPSPRAYEHALLSFGLINVPVSVFNGVVSDHGIKRSEFVTVPVMDEEIDPVTGETKKVPRLDADGNQVYEDHPVGRMAKDKITGEPIEPGTPVVRKVATEYGFVEVADHEIEHLFQLEPKTLTIKAFQPRHLFDQGHYVPRSLYYVEAAKLKVGTKKMDNLKAQQALALLLGAMAQENAIAVVEFTTHGQPKPAIMLPDGTLWLVYHTDALREQRPMPEFELAEAVLEQGRMLIKQSWSEQPLDLTDQRSALIQAFADEKAAAGDFGSAPAPQVETDVETVDGTDLLAMLTASVQQAQGDAKAI